MMRAPSDGEIFAHGRWNFSRNFVVYTLVLAWLAVMLDYAVLRAQARSKAILAGRELLAEKLMLKFVGF